MIEEFLFVIVQCLCGVNETAIGGKYITDLLFMGLTLIDTVPTAKLVVSISLGIMGVGVFEFVFYVLQLLPIRFMQRNLCCICKSMTKHKQNQD